MIIIKDIFFFNTTIFSLIIFVDGYWNTKNCWIPDTLENGSLSIAPHNHTVAAVEEFWK